MSRIQQAQHGYLQNLKTQLDKCIPSNQNTAEVLADLLSVSIESAYRRLRGVSSISLEEAILLKKHLGISLDGLVEGGKSIEIEFQSMFQQEKPVYKYLSNILRKMKRFSKQQNAQVHLMCAGLPFFSQLGYQDLMRYKLHLWHCQTKVSNQENIQFYPEGIDNDLIDLCKKIHAQYESTCVVEVWSANTLDSFLSQVEYSYQCNVFSCDEDVVRIYEDVLKMVTETIIAGRGSEKKGGGAFELYVSETKLTNNSAFLKSQEEGLLAIALNGFNSIQLWDSNVIQEFEGWRESIMNKSLKISGSGEKERLRFKELCLQKIRRSKERCLGPPGKIEEDSKAHQTKRHRIFV
jgi:hypothetical protein